jgi:hypothetical protein
VITLRTKENLLLANFVITEHKIWVSSAIISEETTGSIDIHRNGEQGELNLEELIQVLAREMAPAKPLEFDHNT